MRNLDGICPECKEWTVAGESCCGAGAIVEGSLVTDERAEEMKLEEVVEEIKRINQGDKVERLSVSSNQWTGLIQSLEYLKMSGVPKEEALDCLEYESEQDAPAPEQMKLALEQVYG